MKKQWWQYLDKPAYLALFGGFMLMRINFTLGVILAILGGLSTIVFFLMQQNKS